MTNIMELLSLKDKVALVTGGNRGIGKGICISLAQAGANIAIMARDEKAGKETVEEIKKIGVECIFIKGDVTSSDDCTESVEEAVNKFGKLDIGVNNAGIAVNVPAEKMTWDQWHNIINVNLNGVFLMCQAQGRQMIKQGSGCIINISSISSFIINSPQPQCSYNASKAAVSHLTRSLAYEWAKYNVRVNAIAPGYIGTELLKLGLTTEWGKKWLEYTPMNRVGTPEEVGGLAVYLASDASSFATGSVMIADGGYTLC